MRTIERTTATDEEMRAAIALVCDSGEPLTILHNGQPRMQVSSPREVLGCDDEVTEKESTPSE